MKRVLLIGMFVLSLFIMSGGCAKEHGRRGERWDRDQHSEQHHDQDSRVEVEWHEER